MSLRSYSLPLTLLTMVVLGYVPSRGEAQGVLYPRGDIRIQPFYVKSLRVKTTITDSVAETSVEQTFGNVSNTEQEGTYLFPLPEGATPTAFSLTVGNKTLEPRILPKEEARGIYESIVRRRRDPALLEYVGRGLVRVSVFPIPANGERLIRMRYTEVLKPENGLRKFSYPISTSRFGNRPVASSSVSIQLRTSTPIKNVYSPSHDFSIRRSDERSVNATWEGSNDASDRDLTLYFSTSGDDVGLSLLTYRNGDRDGFFVLLAAPRVQIPKEHILPKQIVFVLDRTGSMNGEKIKQARKSLLFCLNSLHPEDRFNVITFNESPDLLMRHLEPATEANVNKAKHFVENIETSGGTNIDEALHAALDQLKTESGKQKMVVFLTDGLPTVGETNVQEILKHVQQENKSSNLAEVVPSEKHIRQKRLAALATNEPKAPVSGTFVRREFTPARIFCFGLGYDVNVPFLDKLADQERGDADFVKPEEDIEVKVSSFFSKVSSPILSQLKLAFDGAEVYDVYPKNLPDLFKGEQLVITGRFRNGGNGSARLTGLTNDRPETFRLASNFGVADGANAFLPRLWAARKIGYLADQIRLSENPAARKEVIDEIVRLSREYGIITEYTSFLADEQEAVRLGLNPNDPALDRLSSLRSEVGRRALMNGVSGQAATDQSLRAKSMNSQSQVSSRYQNGLGDVTATNEAVTLNKPTGRASGGMGGQMGGGGRNGAAYGRIKGRGGNSLPLPGVLAASTGVGPLVTVQAVNDRTFYRQKNNLWQDHTFDAKKQKVIKVQAFSDAHFALLKAVPALAAYSSVGDEVLVRLGANAVQIGKEGKEKLTDAELKDLIAK